jgi:hypothetical protein
MQLRQIPTLEYGQSKTCASLHFPDVTLSNNEPELPTLCIEEAGVVLELEFPDAAALLRFQQRVAAVQSSNVIDSGAPARRIPVDLWERVLKAIQTGARLSELIEGAWLGFDLDPFCNGCQQLLGELAKPAAAEVGAP